MAHERRAHILRLLAERGSVRSAALAQELGVTDETIRTDLVLLEAQGQLRRRHGGAEFLPPPAVSPVNASRLDYQLASVVQGFVPAGSRLLVDASRLAPTLLSLLRGTPLSLLTHSPRFLQNFSAPSLPFSLLSVAGELDKGCQRLIPAPGALALASPEVALLCPDRVELRGAEVAISYAHHADQLWAAAAVAHVPCLLLAFPSSAIAPWSGSALLCSPHLVVTEDNLPQDVSPPHLHLVPYLDPSSLLPPNSFDY